MESNMPRQPSNRRKRQTACQRCHSRRIKCDAGSHGIPCSACKSKGTVTFQACELLQSKRRRGPNGRYITPSARAEQVESSLEFHDSALSATPIDLQRSEHEPATNLDLAELYAEQHVTASPYSKTSPAATATTSHDWYSAYVNFHSASFRRCHDESTPTSPLAETSPKLIHTELWNKRQYPLALVDNLIQVYMKGFHSICPILNKAHFLAAVQNGTVSPTLMSCVLFIATMHCDAATITTRMGFADRVDACDTHFNDACAAFDADRVMHRPTLIVCAFLLHYWFGRPSMYRDAAWWLGTAIRTAQSLRYHRTNGTEDVTDNSARRRVWWCLYIRDRQVSLSMGSPLIINDLDCDVELPRPQDFDPDESTSARYIRLQAELNRTSSLLFYRHCSPTRLRLVKDPEVCTQACNDILEHLSLWRTTAESWQFWNRIHRHSLLLKVCHEYYTITLLQRLRRHCADPTRCVVVTDALQEAALRMTELVDESLLHCPAEQLPLIYVSAIFSTIAVYTDTCAFQGEHVSSARPVIRPLLLALKQLEEVHVLARWIRTLFTRIMDTNNTEATEPLNRPSSLHLLDFMVNEADFTGDHFMSRVSEIAAEHPLLEDAF